VRRVARFDWDVVEQSIRLASPTKIALNFVDYLDNRNYGTQEFEQLTPDALSFVTNLERRLQKPVTLIGTGPAVDQMIDRRHITDCERTAPPEETGFHVLA